MSEEKKQSPNGGQAPREQDPLLSIFGDLEYRDVVVPTEKAEHLYGNSPTPQGDKALPHKEAPPAAPQKPKAPTPAAPQKAAEPAAKEPAQRRMQPPRRTASAEPGQVPLRSQIPSATAGETSNAPKAVPTPQGAAEQGETCGADDAPTVTIPLQKNAAPKKEDPMPAKKNGENRNTKSGTPGGSTVPSVVKAVIYIVSVLVVSVFLSYFIISVGNDVFAFVKDDTVSTVEITEYMSLDDVAKLLHENGLIKHPTMFKFYIRLKKIKLDFEPGTYEVSPQLNYEEFIKTFNNTVAKQQRETIVITVPEGYTVDEIIDLLCSKGIGTREKFVDVINNYDFGDTYRFLNELPDPLPQGRIYRLEGYLFPDTYYFFQDASEADVIDKFLQNTAQKLTDARFDKAAQEGFSMDQLIILASMVQAEGRYVDEFEDISSVFHNRLANSAKFPYLQSDATIQYVLPEHTVDLTEADLAIDSPYNTYLYAGLTPGAICNPGLNAIDAALYPNDTNYYYFVADAEGHSIFSRTNAEHEAAKQRVKSAAQN